jgi:hypothetical protein
MTKKKLNCKAMKRVTVKLIISVIIMMVVSCDEPITVVTNIVHPDGSVTRKIEMKNSKNKFDLSVLQVPFDNTWSIKDTIKIGEKGDTTYIKTAEKLFKNVDEINLAYTQDSGANKDFSRHTGFKKSFKWFNTEFRFSEIIDKKLSFGYEVRGFLNDDELLYFYSPESVKYEKEHGSDSLKFIAMNDSVNKKVETWTSNNLVSGWIGEFSKLVKGMPGEQAVVESLKSHEDELIKLIKISDKNLDSLWSNGIILKKFLSEADYNRFKTEADSAIEKVAAQIFVNFKEYSVMIVMPGKLIGTNGFVDSTNKLLWPVKSDFFLTEPYKMWAESKIPNIWAWIVSGLFLAFVMTGVIIRINKRG